MKDTAMIKLFGKTIPISEIDLNQNGSMTSSSSADGNIGLHEERRLCSTEKDQVTDKKLSEKEVVEKKQESSGICENPKTPSNDKETSTLRSSKNESDSSHEKSPLKKPDKILPCPRCNSKETKFCYYNNYNVSQPRYFCKNCQRYWTSGGTMRNVPVGAGRRKNKNSSTSQYHHLIVSEALRTAQLGNNAIVLRFGSDSDSVFTLSDKSKSFSGSSITGSNSSEKIGIAAGNSWMPYPLNSAQWNSTMPGPPLFPMTFFPTPPPYMSYAVPAQCISPAHSSVKNSNRNSPTLGKHSREDVLGIKSEKKNLTMIGVGMFDGFQPKGSDKISADMKSIYMEANPAAMSRTVKFRES